MTNDKQKQRGAPTKYKPEFDRIAEVACEEGGLTEAAMAKLFNVVRRTIQYWKKAHPSFATAVNRGKDRFNTATAETCLMKRVKGYYYNEIVKKRVDDRLIETKRIRKHVPPDVTSIIFFLKNRDSDRWRDARQIDGVVKISHEDALEELE